MERHAGWVRDRLVLVPHEPGQRAEEVAVVDDDLVRDRSDRPRDLRAYQLVEVAFLTRWNAAILEGDRKRLQRPVDHPRHQSRDRAAVDAAGQEHAERHIGHQTKLHRLFEELTESLDGAQVGVRASH